jgi:hypothetical protein
MPAVLDLLRQATDRTTAAARGGPSRTAEAVSDTPRARTITAVPAAPAGPAAPTPTAEMSAQMNLVHTARDEVRTRGGRTWARIAAAGALLFVALAFLGLWFAQKTGPNDTAKSAAPTVTGIAASSPAAQPIPVPPAPAIVATAQPEVTEEIPAPTAKSKMPVPRPASSGRPTPRLASSAPRLQHGTPTPSAQPSPPTVRPVTPNDDIMRP